MKEVFPNIYIGAEASCNWSRNPEWAIIHACKHPCHRQSVGYSNTLPSYHPNYLVYRHDNHLVLNMVDMEKELSARFTDPIMTAAMSFIKEKISDRKILVHCNQGMSRSPSIVLLYAAREKYIPNSSYDEAATAFRVLYPEYNPGKGIRLYLTKNWVSLLSM